MSVTRAISVAALTLSLVALSFPANADSPKVNQKKSQAEAEFIVLDVYKDGKIDIATWIKSGRSAQAFKKADKNMDGVIDKQEFIVAQAFCC